MGRNRTEGSSACEQSTSLFKALLHVSGWMEERETWSWVKRPFTTALTCCWEVGAVRLAMQRAMLCWAVLLVSWALPAAKRDDSMLSKVTAEDSAASTAGKKASTSSRAAPCREITPSHRRCLIDNQAVPCCFFMPCIQN